MLKKLIFIASIILCIVIAEKYNFSFTNGTLSVNKVYDSKFSMHPNFDNENNLEIVVARYNEDISNLSKLFRYTKVTIYNKGPDNLGDLPNNFQVINLPNIGREGHTYLHHVIMNYDNLAKRTIFLQGDFSYRAPNWEKFIEGSPSKCPNIVVELENGQDCITETLGGRSEDLLDVDWKNTKWHDTRLSDETFLEFTQNNINPSFDFNTLINWLPDAQFAVDREHILCHGIEFHKKLYDYFNHKSPIEGHYMERLWNEWANCNNKH